MQRLREANSIDFHFEHIVKFVNKKKNTDAIALRQLTQLCGYPTPTEIKQLRWLAKEPKMEVKCHFNAMCR